MKQFVSGSAAAAGIDQCSNIRVARRDQPFEKERKLLKRLQVFQSFT